LCRVPCRRATVFHDSDGNDRASCFTVTG
jgi:hypothetical protein